MKYFKTPDLIAGGLAIVGAINWGLVGLFNFNLVHTLFGWVKPIERLVYVTVGLSGAWFGYRLLAPSDTGSEIRESIEAQSPVEIR